MLKNAWAGNKTSKAHQTRLAALAIAGGTILATAVMVQSASAAVSPPETFGQFCTATFGASSDPQCQGATPAALATFQSQCAAAGGTFVPGSDPASPLFGNQARCIAGASGGTGGTSDAASLDRRRAYNFINRVLEQFDYEAFEQRRDAVLSYTRDLSELLALRANESTNTGVSRFAAEPESRFNSADLPWNALGYADPRSPVYKAGPYTPAPRISYGTWGQGFGEWERRSGTFDGTAFSSHSSIGGGQGGAHAIIRDMFSSRDAFAIGLSGGGTSGRYRSNDGSTVRIDGPGVGLYAVYVNNGFSTQQVFNADFFTLRATTPFETLPDASTKNYSYASDWNYRYQLGAGYWLEPTVGIALSQTKWDATSAIAGHHDGHVTRLQGGARVGRSFDWNGIQVTSSLTGLAQDYASITGGFIAPPALGAVAVLPTDEGKVFGRGIATVNFSFTRSFSAFVEGEIRGRSGVTSSGVRGGLSYVFN